MGLYDNMNKKFRKTIGLEMRENAVFVPLKDYLAKNKKVTELVIHGYIITNSKFGKSVAVVVDNKTFVSLPARCVEEFENMTDAQFDGCLAGKMKLANFETIDTKQGKTITFTYEEA